MAIQAFTTQAQRRGVVLGEILAHAEPVQVLGITGMQKKMPKNEGESIKFRRWLPYGGTDNKWITTSNVSTFASNQLLAEGVTPSADTLTATDITATLSQYGCLYSFTDKVADLYEDDVASEMKRQTGQRIGLIREMVRYGELKAMTNAFYAGGTSRATVDESISVNLIRKVTKSLKANHAKMVTKILDSSPEFGVSSVEASFLVFCHTDMEPAIRNLEGFTQVADYGNRKMVHENEFGSVENFRFITSPELAPYADSGAAVGSTGLYSTTGSNIDVYPVIVAGEDAWGQVALRGENSLSISFIPTGTESAADPLGQKGYIGAKTWFVAKMLNNGWAAVVECGTPDLA